jgi:peptidyl-dipeptidase Dcp
MNPLLQPFETPFETAPFDIIKDEHFLPALTEAVRLAKTELAALKSNPEVPTFANTIEALENAGQAVNRVSEIFFNLNHADTNEERQKTAKEFSPALTEYGNDILLDTDLFARIKVVFEQKDALNLTSEQSRLLEKTYKGFVRNGANLDEAQKQRLREIDKEAATLALEFGEHILADTNSFELVIENPVDLSGLPEGVVEMAKMTAEQKGKAGKWVFTLDYPSYMPFMTYADNRALRKEMHLAFGSKGFRGNENDNREIIKRIAVLRHQRADLLGYATHADFVLEERMASSPKVVKDFFNELLTYAKPACEREIRELTAYAHKSDSTEQLERWDFAYYSEKLKMEKFNFDDELLKPYFKLENVIQGVFTVAEKLFGITFHENNAIPKYHPEVIAYQVKDRNQQHLAVFYADFFPRTGKRDGAWMTSFSGQRVLNGTNHRPHVSIVCNFTKPTETKPSLLTFNEVVTLFHEFGHALHGMLANCTYESFSGTNVYWDFVELPSQLMENWSYEKESLDLFARHYETNEAIPTDLMQKIKDAKTFQEGYQTMRQLSFGILDMAWHTQNPENVSDIADFERDTLAPTQILPTVEGTLASTAFSHIFQGGYSAGYYSYKWAEVLEADAFELFHEKGIFDSATATAYMENILAKGGSEHPMTLYKRFRGHEPSPKALLRKAGLLEEN